MGNLGSVVTFLLTISFLFSTPLAVQLNHGFPVLGDGDNSRLKMSCCSAHRFGLCQRR
jgi:uncharacterized membrane protein YkgB